jgi:hypothetical protein
MNCLSFNKMMRLRQLFFDQQKIGSFCLYRANLVWELLLSLWPSKQIQSGPESLK